MPSFSRRIATLIGAALLCAAPAWAGYDVRMSSFRSGLYRIYGVGVLLDMPDCMRPCAKCTGYLDTERLALVFTERTCPIERAYRVIQPELGHADLVLTPRGRDLYVSRDRDWLFETVNCAVPGPAIDTRIVIDGRRNRLLMIAPDHPDASLTGRVRCAVNAVYIKVEL